MKIKIGLGQLDINGGQPAENLRSILRQIEEAKQKKVDLLVFPEMAISGYLISDTWEDDAFVYDCFEANDEIRRASKGITIIFGNVLPDKRDSVFFPGRNSFGNDGRLRKFNAAFVVSGGKYVDRKKTFPKFRGQNVFTQSGVTVKTNEPLYREFEDQRHFLSLKEYAQQLGISLKDLLVPFEVLVKGKKISVGVLICEDLWTNDYVYHGEVLDPAKILVENGAEVLVAISASPFGWRKNNARSRNIHIVQKRLWESGQPRDLVYVNAVGAQNNGKNEFLFDGRSAVFGQNGKCEFEAPAWRDGVFCYEINVKEGSPKKIFFEVNPELTKIEEREEILQGLTYGIKKFARQKRIKNFVVGLSGGIDSSLVAYLCVQAMGKKHVFGVNMPTKFNSSWTKGVAARVAKNLGISYQVVGIEEMANLNRSLLEKIHFNGKYGKFSAGIHNSNVDESIQARLRSGAILSAIASKYPNTVYTCNGNKTEILLGYLTVDGDGRGAICPLGDLFKTQIIDLAAHINEHHSRSGQKIIFPWELIAPLFDPRRYYDNWNGKETLIPEGTNSLVPSAELSKSQDVTKRLGDPIIFPYHDPLLREFIEYRKNPEDILSSYVNAGRIGLSKQLRITPETVERTFKKPSDWLTDLEKTWDGYHLAVYKQIQSPPIITVSKRSLGYDFRRSQVNSYLTGKYFRTKNLILKSNRWALPDRINGDI